MKKELLILCLLTISMIAASCALSNTGFAGHIGTTPQEEEVIECTANDECNYPSEVCIDAGTVDSYCDSCDSSATDLCNSGEVCAGADGQTCSLPPMFIGCGMVVNEDGTNIVLEEDIDCSSQGGVGVSIEASDVTIDCAGHSIIGPGASQQIQQRGVMIDELGATVKNCEIKDWQVGIWLERGEATVSDNTLTQNERGVAIAKTLTDDTSLFSDNTIENNGKGIWLYEAMLYNGAFNERIEGNRICHNDRDISFDSSIPVNAISGNDNTCQTYNKPYADEGQTEGCDSQCLVAGDPDLVITEVTSAPCSSSGYTCYAPTIKNIGGASPAKDIYVCRSSLGGNRCPQLGANTRVSLPALATGQSVTLNENYFVEADSQGFELDQFFVDSRSSISETDETNNNYDLLSGPFCVEQEYNHAQHADACADNGYSYDACVGYAMTRANPASNNLPPGTSPFVLAWVWNSPDDAEYCEHGCADGACQGPAPMVDLELIDVSARVAPLTDYVSGAGTWNIEFVEYEYTIRNNGDADFTFGEFPGYNGEQPILGFLNATPNVNQDQTHFSAELGPNNDGWQNTGTYYSNIGTITIGAGETKTVSFPDIFYEQLKGYRYITKYKIDIGKVNGQLVDTGNHPGVVEESNEDNNVFEATCAEVFEDPSVC